MDEVFNKLKETSVSTVLRRPEVHLGDMEQFIPEIAVLRKISRSSKT